VLAERYSSIKRCNSSIIGKKRGSSWKVDRKVWQVIV
jgi:hypothetical protein